MAKRKQLILMKRELYNMADKRIGYRAVMMFPDTNGLPCWSRDGKKWYTRRPAWAGNAVREVEVEQ